MSSISPDAKKGRLLASLAALAFATAGVAACGDDSSNDPTSPPTGDPEYDELAQECYEGDLSACDDLFWGSEADSEYETYGLTCGGRRSEDAVEVCEDDLD